MFRVYNPLTRCPLNSLGVLGGAILELGIRDLRIVTLSVSCMTPRCTCECDDFCISWFFGLRNVNGGLVYSEDQVPIMRTSSVGFLVIEVVTRRVGPDGKECGSFLNT